MEKRSPACHWSSWNPVVFFAAGYCQFHSGLGPVESELLEFVMFEYQCITFTLHLFNGHVVHIGRERTVSCQQSRIQESTVLDMFFLCRWDRRDAVGCAPSKIKL